MAILWLIKQLMRDSKSNSSFFYYLKRKDIEMRLNFSHKQFERKKIDIIDNGLTIEIPKDGTVVVFQHQYVHNNGTCSLITAINLIELEKLHMLK